MCPAAEVPRKRIARIIYFVICIICVTSVGLIATYMWRSYDAWRHDNACIQLMQLYRAYAQYMRDNNGKLPNSVDDLLTGGYLRKIKNINHYDVYGPVCRSGEFIPVYDKNEITELPKWHMRYGGSVNDYEMRDERVYQIATQQSIAFVNVDNAMLMERSYYYTYLTVDKYSQLEQQGLP